MSRQVVLMAVGENVFPLMHPVKGVRLGTVCAGIKYSGKRDLVVIKVCSGSHLAGVFTRNAFCAAPVHIAKQHLSELATNLPAYLVVNTGNANAGTGETGFNDANTTCEELAAIEASQAGQVLPFSTGVIGEPLPIDKIVSALPQAITALTDNNWSDAATGIMTTDTRPKGSSRQITLAGKVITITGIAKGAGMIKPNMATMLGFIATDLSVPQATLNDLVRKACDKSFNRVTIDGDTSTNDSVILIATGQSGVDYLQLGEAEQVKFSTQLYDVFVDLAQQIVKDGEGATKFVTVQVSGGANTRECLDVAYTVAESPLVKTALFASDPNWGRILAAVGRSGIEQLAVEGISIALNDALIVEKGGRANSYTEAAGQVVMDGDEITINIDLQRGNSCEQVWTCDLSYDYVRINAEYRT